jgi:fructose-bisphosphate aldolase class I
MNTAALSKTISDLVINGKGILAADESSPTIAKRFKSINIESNEEYRRAYRSLLATTPKLGEHVSGVILYEETLGQKTDQGKAIPQAFAAQGIVPGIKVDKGLVSLPSFGEDKVTQGLDGLPERLQAYAEQGARFAKWRAVFSISAQTPSQFALDVNAHNLARYAAICQDNGIVPIVEPEVLMDGRHTLATCEQVTSAALQAVFNALYQQRVSLEHIILKPNMVIPAKDCVDQSSAIQIAEATLRVLRQHVPAAVPSINFLSGGQTPEQATLNLNAMNSLGQQPWFLSFSYGRALQETCLAAWRGSPENLNAAQQELFKRAKLNGAASLGKYTASME